MQKKKGSTTRTHQHVVLATSSIKTMEKEFLAEASKGLEIVGQGMFVKPPIMGGNEYLLFLERPVQ